MVYMVSFTHVIVGPEGLHARPVAQICSQASKVESTVTVRLGSTTASATDLMGLMRLDARKGDELEIMVEGPFEQADAEVMKKVFTF